ncbi:f09d6ae8-f7f5-4785-bafb-f45a54106423 [Thermothielavioides terrestris]|jgi:hypothetical protein|uniref:F09d6ae8-f7f5-4785-bafb-f45a54106423 n=1 Tax=Thermothielavioides terrestris TaxID=2587410 RepID=A0A446BRU2_9PEZI|nr:f09d6ae8-f7f5-4785-bafb-f45a54106423 [Thermothielavioides terrestris]
MDQPAGDNQGDAAPPIPAIINIIDSRLGVLGIPLGVHISGGTAIINYLLHAPGGPPNVIDAPFFLTTVNFFVPYDYRLAWTASRPENQMMWLSGISINVIQVPAFLASLPPLVPWGGQPAGHG